MKTSRKLFAALLWTMLLALLVVTGGSFAFCGFLIAFLIPAVVAIVMMYSIYYIFASRKQVLLKNPFAWSDLAAVPIALAAWWIPSLAHWIFGLQEDKSLTNLLVDPFVLSVVWSILWIVRLGWFSREGTNKSHVSWIMTGILSVASFIIYFVIPGLPE